MVHDQPIPHPPESPRHPFRRWAWILPGIIAVGIGVTWATEPARRREILFEAPIRLETGTVVRGRFTPDHEGPYVIELRFRQAWLEAASEAPRGGDDAFRRLSAAVGGGWSGEIRPPGFVASYSVRSGSVPVAGGGTGDHLTGFFGPREVGVQIAWIDQSRPVPQDFEVRIDRAVESLAEWDARLVVAASGDWISYARLEATLRGAVVVVAAIVASLLLVALKYLTSRRRARRVNAAGS